MAKVGGQRGWLSDPLDRNGEHISHAALGLDDARRAGVAFELASEAKNLHVDAAIEGVVRVIALHLLQQLIAGRPVRLSRAQLETLAIIAYRQPIGRIEIEEIRGVETSSVLRTLCERKLVRIVGRKDVPGRPIMYGTTKFFLEHFGLQDLSQLPPLREFKELGESEQALLPIEEESLAGC